MGNQLARGKNLLLKFVEKVTNLATCLHTTLSEFHFHFFLVTSLSGNYYVLLLLVCRLATLNKIKKGGLLKKCCHGFSAIFLLNSVTILLKFSYSQSFPLGVKCLSCFLCNEKLNLAQKYRNVLSNVGIKQKRE